jgi:hypothetical protein
MMPRERYFLGEMASGYWYKKCCSCSLFLFYPEMRFLEEVKEQKSGPALSHENPYSSRPEEAASQKYGGRVAATMHILHYAA